MSVKPPNSRKQTSPKPQGKGKAKTVAAKEIVEETNEGAEAGSGDDGEDEVVSEDEVEVDGAAASKK